MIGYEVMLRHRMSAGEAHYAGNLVQGAYIVNEWGDVGTELAIRLFGDESLFVGYSEVRYTAPVFAGDWMEYSGYIEKVGNTSFTCHFEAKKVMELEKDWQAKGLADSAANVLPEPVLCAYATGTLMVKKENQRLEAADPKFVADLKAYKAAQNK